MNPVNILIADDHVIIRKGLRSILSAHPDWQVCADAANGREAVTAAQQHQPDIVIMDINMPELNGLEATKQIVIVSPLSQVLILSAYDSENLVRQMLLSGARGYVLKSDIRDDLIAGVEALCRGQLYFTSSISGYVLEQTRRGIAEPPTPRTDKAVLTAREKQVLQLLAEGKTNKQIATAMELSVRTVESHRGHLMNKLEMHSVSELVRYAIQKEIIKR